MTPRSTVRWLCVALCAPWVLPAQSTARGDVWYASSAAVSYYTDRGPHFALLRNRKVWMVDWRRERVFAVRGPLAVAATVDIPVSLIAPRREPASAECWRRKSTGAVECYEIVRPRSPVGAVGVNPLGIKIYALPGSRIQPFGSLAAGGVAFDRSTPVAAGSSMNFAAEYQLGVHVGVNRGHALELAWKFQHWSNANLTYFNPGLDVNMVTLALMRRR